MKKRFIPATVAALALTFSAVAVPQAVAQNTDGAQTTAQDEAFQAHATIKPGETKRVTYGELFDHIEGAEGRFAELRDVVLDLEGLTWEFDDNNQRDLVATDAVEEGNHPVEVTLTYGTATNPETLKGTVNVTVEDITAPVLKKPEDKTGEIGQKIEPFKVQTSEDVTFTSTGLPEGLTLDPATGEISGTPTKVTETPAEVTVNATDAAGNAAEAVTFTFTVTADKTDPVLTKPENKTAEANTAIAPFTVQASEDVTFAITGLPEGLDFDATTGEISGTPTTVTEEPVTVTVNAEDAAGNDAEAVTFTFTVTADETDPVLTKPENKTAVIGQKIESFTVQASEDVTFTSTGLPEGLTLDPATGEISGTPTTVTEEPVTVTVNAEDAAGNDAEAVTFTYEITEAPEGDGSSLNSSEGSSADDIDWGLVGVGGVLAAVIGVIAAIGGGFIQLPPAIANLIPFL